MYYMCSIIVGGCIDFYAIRAFSEVVQRGVGGSARKLGRGLLGVGTAQAPAESTARKELEEQISQSACAMGGGGVARGGVQLVCISREGSWSNSTHLNHLQHVRKHS